MAKGGRKRKSGDRYPNGELKHHRDHGTHEAAVHRLALVGSADPVLGEHSLGILLARGVITEEQHQAGVRYAARSWEIYGKPFARSALGPMVVSKANPEAEAPPETAASETPEEREAKREAEFIGWHATLRDAGQMAVREVKRCAVADELPGWWLRQNERNGRPLSGSEATRHRRRHNALCAGLNALAEAQGIIQKRRAA